jgi:hypothetical protein
MAGGSGPSPKPDADAAASSGGPAAQQKMARERAELVTLKAEKAKREEDEKIAKLAAEMQAGQELDAALVKTGRFTPHTVKLLGSMKNDEKRELLKSIGGAPTGAALGRFAPPSSGGTTVEAVPGIEMSDFEAMRVKAYAENKKRELVAAGKGHIARDPEEVVKLYRGHREQQFRGAKTDEQVKRLGRRVEQDNVLLSANGNLVVLTQQPGEADRRVRPVVAALARRVPHELQPRARLPSRRCGRRPSATCSPAAPSRRTPTRST